MGSKAKLTEWIISTMLNETRNVETFVDIFAGTASIAKAASKYYKEIIINDILYANNVIYKAFFLKSKWDKQKLQNLLNYYNDLNPSKLEENYFSINYGDKFFDYANAKLIGYIRDDIENKENEFNEKELSILLSSLIYSMDKIANTVGHFDAYIKKPIKHKDLNIKLIQPIEINKVSIFQEDANKLAHKIKSDLVYIDPPYNSRQYSRFYHLYENLVKWDKPELYGVALKPEPENMSAYCTVRAKKELDDLIKNLDTSYIVVSYNNTYNSKSHSSENKIKLEEIEAILKERGKTKILDCNHKFFNAGKTDFENHKELLFITKVNG
ncbi:MAG: DNA adenine methylase [Dysgonomonas sp.]